VTAPRVSVVVPTRGRPELVVRAVESALAQTLSDLEVIVVLDGPDDDARRRLDRIADARLRRVVLPAPRGIGAARNAGVLAAAAVWVAFLDDDDEWVPEKLAVVLGAAEASRYRHPIVASRILVRGGPDGDRVWPRRLPEAGEALGDYLFAPRWGDALVHTSTLLVPRALLEAAPFDERLRKHEDLDWLLRASRVSGTGLDVVSEPLAVWHADPERPRASTVPDWRRSLAWIRSVRGLVTGRAYASFVLTWLAADAVRERSLPALWRLPWEAFRRGRPTVVALGVFVAVWTLPAGVRRRLRRRAG